MKWALSFSISSRVRVAASPGLSLSSRTSSSAIRPSRPPASLNCLTASSAERIWSLASAPNGPVTGVGKPMRIVSAARAGRGRPIPASVPVAAMPATSVRRESVS